LQTPEYWDAFTPPGGIEVPGEDGRLECYFEEYPPGICTSGYGMNYSQGCAWHFRNPLGERIGGDDVGYAWNNGPWYSRIDPRTGVLFGWGWGCESIATATAQGLQQAMPAGPVEDLELIYDNVIEGPPKAGVATSYLRDQARVSWKRSGSDWTPATGTSAGETCFEHPEFGYICTPNYDYTTGVGHSYALELAGQALPAAFAKFEQARGKGSSRHNEAFDSIDDNATALYNDPKQTVGSAINVGFNSSLLMLFGPYIPVTDT
jgi:hypothetical protein